MPFVTPGGVGGWSLLWLTPGVKEPSYAIAGKILFAGSETVLILKLLFTRLFDRSHQTRKFSLCSKDKSDGSNWQPHFPPATTTLTSTQIHPHVHQEQK